MGKQKKTISILTASVITIAFLFFAITPGIFSMIGYTISIMIFPENSDENLKYGKLILCIFDILCGGLLFWIVYNIMKRILK
jgi:hypothetical protein